MTGTIRPGLKEEYAPEEWKAWRIKHQSPENAPSDPPLAPIDIIAVQGLAANYDTTWSRVVEDGSRIMWLRDLLRQDIPTARILTFEYDTKWLQDPSAVKLRDCADHLLESIMWDRTHRGESKMCSRMAQRPLVFIGHSFGGLVIKRALVKAALARPSDPLYENYRAFICAVSGVVFLGTPHAGSKFATWGESWANFRALFAPRGNIEMMTLLRPLTIESTTGVLDDLHMDFQKVLAEDFLINLQLSYFWETKREIRFGYDFGFIVDKISACYGASPDCCYQLETNHSDMNKFGSRKDDNYRRVVQQLSEICQNAYRIILKRNDKSNYSAPSPSAEIKEIHDWLQPATKEIFEVYDKMKQAQHLDTCKWVLAINSVQDWLSSASIDQSHSPILFYGKAGSGKSVLSTFLYDHANSLVLEQNSLSLNGTACAGTSKSTSCEVRTSERCAALYFPLRADQQVTAVIGTLVDSLLRSRPRDIGLQKIVIACMRENVYQTFAGGVKLLVKVLQYFDRTYIVLDGLDEFDAPAELSVLLQSLSGISSVRLAVLGREMDLATTSMAQKPDAILNVADYNNSDILKFSQKAISALAEHGSLFTPELRSEIQTVVTAKAQGMFQWATLVIHDLKFCRSRSDVLKTLENYPPALDQAYSKTFSRLNNLPDVTRERIVIALKWLIATPRPMALKELREAIELQNELENVKDIDESMVPRLASLKESDWDDEEYFTFLGPLATILNISTATTAREQENLLGQKTIQICHHSLRQWIFAEPAKTEASPNACKYFRFSITAAHEQAAAACLWTMSSYDLLVQYVQDMNRQDVSPSFIHYAGEYGSYHLKLSGPLVKRPFATTAWHDITNAATKALKHELELASMILSALSSALMHIPLQDITELHQGVAIRDLQLSILPAVSYMGKVHNALPNVYQRLKNYSHDTDSLSQVSANPTRLYDYGGDQDVQYLSADLESSQMSRFTEYAQRHRQAFHQFRSTIDLFRKTSQALRRVTIFVAVEPIRSWVLGQMGSEGLSPILVLAHCADLTEVLLSATLLEPTNAGQNNFRSQFQASPDHPLYGLIMATNYELSKQKSTALTSVFYKEHVSDHFKLRYWEWKTVQATLSIFDLIPQSRSYPLREVVLQHWLFNYVKVAQPSDTRTTQSARAIFDKTSSRVYSGQAVRVGELGWSIGRFLYSLGIRLITFVSPKLESVALAVMQTLRDRLRLARPLIRGIAQDWKRSSVSILLYALRLRHFPWLFSTLRNRPWKDLKGAFSDPFQYEATPSAGSRILLLQELVLGTITFVDAVGVQNPALARYMVPSILRGAFFDRSPNLPPNPSRFPLAIVRLPLSVLLNFWRLIFLERTLFHLAYLLYDLIKATARLVAPGNLNWTVVRSFALNVVTILLQTQLSLKNMLLTSAALVSVVSVGNRLPSLMKAAASLRSLRKSIISGLYLIFPLVPAMAQEFGAKLAEIRQQNPALFVSSSIGVLISMFGAFIYNMKDPLNMRYAQSLSLKAIRISNQVSGVNNPIAFLKWQNGLSRRL